MALAFFELVKSFLPVCGTCNHQITHIFCSLMCHSLEILLPQSQVFRLDYVIATIAPLHSVFASLSVSRGEH